LDLDVNGLYAATMREALPVSDFEWMTKDEIACLNIDDVPDDTPTGYILEGLGPAHPSCHYIHRANTSNFVDLKYPHDLHDTHSDFPLAPVKQSVPYDW
ncbi:unnamed protein product, partial [Ixodes persulcatus]